MHSINKKLFIKHYSRKTKVRIKKKYNQIFGYPCCSISEDHSIDVSITNVGLILTKLRRFQHFGTSQNSISTFFKIKYFLGFHGVVLVKTFPLMHQILM